MNRHRNDRGFTLPELMITMTLMGLIVTVMAAVVSVSLRTLPTTEQRADSAVNVQGLVTWLPTDVDSTEPGQFDVLSSTASGCAGVDPGRNLLRLRWQETLLTVTTNFVANYRYVPQPNGGGRIFRLTCSGQGSLGAPISLSMTGLLPDWVVGDEPVEVLTYDSDGDARDDLITFKVTNLNGGEIFAEAATKNPAESLPSTSIATATTLSPTTTTPATTTTTVAPGPTTTVVGPTTTTTTTTTSSTTTTEVPCVVSAMTVLPSTVQTHNNGTGRLKKDITVTIVPSSGYCIGLTLRYDTGAANGQYIQNFPTNAPYVVTIQGHPQGNENWVPGPHALEVRDGSNNLLISRTLNVTS